MMIKKFRIYPVLFLIIIPFAMHSAEASEISGTGMVSLQQGSGGQQPMRSRVIIDEGEMIEMTGVLIRREGSWSLMVNGLRHELYLAPLDYQESLGMSIDQGKRATLTGFFRAENAGDPGVMAVCTIEVDGESYRLRDDQGRPLWRARPTEESSCDS